MKKTNLLYLFAFLFCSISGFSQNCISDVFVERNDCNPFGEYDAYVQFNYSPNVDSVSIFFNGNFLGNHPADAQPIVLSPIQGGDQFNDVEVVSTTSSTCRDSFSYQQICEFGPEDCLSEIHDISSFCLDSTLTFILDYTFLNPVSEAHILVNGAYVVNGMIGENISQTISIENNSSISVYEVVIRDPEFLSCGDTTFVQVESCIENCVDNFDYTTICNADGTYNLNVFVSGPSDSLIIYLDSELIGGAGTNADTTSIFTMAGLEVDSVIMNRTLTLCKQNNPSCCTTISFDVPQCVPTLCEMELLSTEIICQGGIPLFQVNYNYLNPEGSGEAYVNGSLVATFESGENKILLLDAQIYNQLGLYEIIIKDSSNGECQDIETITDYYCDCFTEVSNITTECLENDTYRLEFDLFSEASFNNFSLYPPDNSIISLADFIDANNHVIITLNTNQIGDFLLSSDEVFTCQTSFTVDVDCETTIPCNIEILSTEAICQSGVPLFQVQYNYTAETSNAQAFVNGNLAAFLEIGSNKTVFLDAQVFDGQGLYEIKLSDANNPDCQDIFTYENYYCDCFTEVFNVSTECLSDGNYQLDFDIETEVNNTFFTLFFPDQTSIDLSDIITPNYHVRLNLNTNQVGDLRLTSNNSLLCEDFFTVDVDCDLNPDCNIEILSTEVFCQEGFPVFQIQYNYTSDTINGQAFVNGNLVSFLEEGLNKTVLLDGEIFDGQGNYEITLSDSGNFECEDVFTYEEYYCECFTEVTNVTTLCLQNGAYQLDFDLNTEVSNKLFTLYFPDQTSIDLSNIIDVNNHVQLLLGTNQVGRFDISSDRSPICQDFFDVDVDCNDTNECNISINQTELDCNIEGLFININYSATNLFSEAHVYLNGQFNSNADEGLDKNTTIYIEDPLDNQSYSIEIRDAEFTTCVDSVFIPNFSCGPCAVNDYVYSGICESDSTYRFSFENNDPQSPVEVYLNDVSIGTHTAGTPDLVLENLPAVDPNQVVEVKICSEIYDCCSNEFFNVPNCAPPIDTCKFTFIQLGETECNENSTYDAEVFITIDDYTGNMVSVFVNNQFFGISPYSTQGLAINNITPRTNSDFDIITICSTEQDSCCQTVEYLQPNCDPVADCLIGDIDLQFNCISNDEFVAIISFEYENIVGDTVEVFTNQGISLGFFNVQNQPFLIEQFTLGTNEPFGVVIKSPLDDNCINESPFITVFCATEECEFTFIENGNPECNADGTYDLEMFYGLASNNASSIIIEVNGIFYDTVQVNTNGSFLLKNVAGQPGTIIDVITLCVVGFPNCCISYDFVRPDCTINDCIINEIEIEYECDGDSTYFASVYYTNENTSGSVDIIINGVSFGIFNANNQPHLVGPLLSTVPYQMLVKDAQQEECVANKSFQYNECIDTDEECNLEYIEILSANCNGDGTFNMTAEYGFTNADNNFVDVFLSGTLFDTYVIGNSVLLENIPLSITNDIKTITICLNDNPDCCKTINYLQPECSTTQDSCSLNIIEVDYICEGGNFDQISFEVTVNGSSMDNYLISVNGELLGTGLFTDQSTTVGPIDQNDDGFYVINVIDTVDGTCFDQFELLQAFCAEDCLIGEIEVEIACIEDGIFSASLTFPYDSDSQALVSIKGNGNDYGQYDAFNQPIVIDSLITSSVDFWEFVVISAANPDCSSEVEIGEVDCGDNCFIENLEVEYSCDDEELIYFNISFDTSNFSSEFKIQGNGTNYGTFGIDDLPVELGPFDPLSNDDWEFVVTDMSEESCSAVVVLGAVNCDDTTVNIPCAIDGFEIFDVECIGDNEYSISVNFEVEATVNIPFTFFINGMLQNSTTVNSLPLNVIGITPNDSSDVDIITICLDGLVENCCIDFEYEQPACLFSAVDNTLIADVVLSPNPTTDYINISNIPVQIVELRVLDNLGRVVERRTSQGQVRLDVANYQAGIYMVQFTTVDNKIMTKRFVKMN